MNSLREIIAYIRELERRIAELERQLKEHTDQPHARYRQAQRRD